MCEEDGAYCLKAIEVRVIRIQVSLVIQRARVHWLTRFAAIDPLRSCLMSLIVGTHAS